MCLITKQICPLRARKDIVCYKFFRYSIDKGFMHTRYVNTKVKMPSENNPTMMDDSNKAIQKRACASGNTYLIAGGMIHAYIKEPLLYDHHVLCYKCIIPKGTLYYVSYDHSEICAKRMLITERNCTKV